MKIYRKGAKGALLDEYERAIFDLKKVISNISNDDLKQLVDTQTKDEDCRSIQSILSHVVRSGYIYAMHIQDQEVDQNSFPKRKFHPSVSCYIQDLQNMFIYTERVFQMVEEEMLVQSDASKKIHVSWNQLYDIEQLMEHAIVHILRHRRQIEKFKIGLKA